MVPEYQRVVRVRRRRRHRSLRHRIWRTVRFPLLIVAIAAVAAGLYLGLLARDVADDARIGRDAMNNGLALLNISDPGAVTPAQVDLAVSDFQAAAWEFGQARDRLGGWGAWATAHPSLLPGPAAQLSAAAPLLDLGRDTAAMAATLSQGVRPVLVALHTAGTPGGRLPALTAALQSSVPALNAAAVQLATAERDRQRVAALPAVPQATHLLQTFDRRLPQLAGLVRYLPKLPPMLGSQGARSYLLVFQDPADLRATGGFIGSAALITLDRGHLSQIDYQTTTIEGGRDMQLPVAVAGPPPLPLLYYRHLGAFELRDANFWPDFPQSAAAIENRYFLASGLQVEGVLAVDPTAVSDLLQALGPVAVPGYPGTLTAANAVATIEYYTHYRPGIGSDPHRKRYIITALHALLNQVQQVDAGRLRPLMAMAQQAFSGRSVQLSVHDPFFATQLQQLHWDGSLRDGPGDYLGVFDQNVTDSKVNPFISEAISYTAVRRPDGSLQSTVRITYTNRTAHAELWIPRTYYRDYLRVAVPQSVSDIVRTGYDETFWPDETEHGRHLIAGGFTVVAHATRTVILTYNLPASVLAGVPGYRLQVQKQAGSLPSPLQVRVTNGARTWTANLLLTQDTRFSIPWQAPSGPLQVALGA